MNTNLRKLVYVPILHAREDSGQAASVLRENEKSSAKGQEFKTGQSAVGEMWAGITAKIEELNLPWNKTRIYQDGLPVSGNESEIVTQLAENGSWNHRRSHEGTPGGARRDQTDGCQNSIRTG